jgi:hypothetical protein
MRRVIVGLASLAFLILGSVADAQAQGKLAVLFHGARGGPNDFLIRNQSSFDRAGFSTVVVSSAETGSTAANAAQQRGQRVYFVAMSRGAGRAASAIASGVKPAALVVVSGVYEEAMASLGSPSRLPPTLVVAHAADECPRTSPEKARQFVRWAGGKASIRWISVTGTPVGRKCGARHAHGFFQNDGAAVAAIISFIRSR